jgi:hypothetical protein
MNKDEIVEFLEDRLAKVRKQSPGAWNTIGSYEAVISDILSDE